MIYIYQRLTTGRSALSQVALRTTPGEGAHGPALPARSGGAQLGSGAVAGGTKLARFYQSEALLRRCGFFL